MRQLALLLLGSVLSACVSIGLPGDESPLTGASANLAPVPLRPAWRRVLSAGAIYLEKPKQFASVAFDEASGRVWTGSSSGWLECLGAAGGDPLWRRRLDGTISGHAAFARGLVLVGTDEGKLLAVDADTGATRWEYRVAGAITKAPVIQGDAVYFVDGANALYALGIDGEWRWQYRRDAPAEFALVGEARPALSGGRIHVGFSDGRLVTLDAADGAVVWERDLSPEHDRFQDVDASPVIVGDLLLAASAAAGLYALDPATGEIRWTVPMGGILQTAEVDGDVLVAVDGGRVLRLDGRTGATRWQTQLGHTVGAPGAPVVVGPLVAVATSKGALYLLDKRTGEPRQRFDPGTGFLAAPSAGTDGSLFVLSNGGVLYALRP